MTILDSESSYWGCPEHILKPMKWHVFRSLSSATYKNWLSVALSAPKFDFQKVLQNASIVSKLTSNHFWGVSVRFGINFIPLEQFWSDFKRNEKNEFSKKFCLDFKQFQAYFMHKSLPKFEHFWLFEFFSKMKPLIKNPKRWSF